MYLFPQKPVKLDVYPQKKKNSIGWKVFFWLMFVLIMTSVFALVFFRALPASHYDYMDFFVSLFSIAGLLGFAYYRPIFNPCFWRCFLWVFVIENIIYWAILPILGIKHFGVPVTLDTITLLNIVCMAATMYALHRYAYKKGFIWEKNNG